MTYSSCSGKCNNSYMGMSAKELATGSDNSAYQLGKGAYDSSSGLNSSAAAYAQMPAPGRFPSMSYLG